MNALLTPRHSTRLRVAFGALALLVALPASAPLRADDHGRDHDLARQAFERGEVLPLRGVLERIEREQQGQVLRVEFERDDGRFVYKIRLLQADGHVARIKVDAVDGRVLGIKRRSP
ncbi:MAG: PepSY domain-containing protein [Proteobacteria bacterium]|nr:PepSY domain-containing protein [Pseudomonadota bacterium]